MIDSRAGLCQAIREHAGLVARVEDACLDVLARFAERTAESLAAGGKILFFGNGGSAADAQHLAAELTVRFARNRRPLAAVALTTDTSALTACANDLGFEHVFARQVEALGRPGDVAAALSTSGNSPNVVAALAKARELGLVTAAFTGETGGRLCGLAEYLIAVPSQSAARIQEMHILLGHLLCQDVEDRLRP